jgi:hypothetical protein
LISKITQQNWGKERRKKLKEDREEKEEAKGGEREKKL